MTEKANNPIMTEKENTPVMTEKANTPIMTEKENNPIVNAMMSTEESNDIQTVQRGTPLSSIIATGERKQWRAWLSPCTTQVFFVENESSEFPSTIEVMDICEIRIGCRTDELHTAREGMNQTDAKAITNFEECCFSVHRGEDGDLIHSLVATCPEDARRWVRVLTLLVKRNELSIRQSRCDPKYWLRRVFQECDTFHRNYLSLQQCKTLLKTKLNVAMEDDRVELCFQAANYNLDLHEGQQGLDLEEFYRFYQLISHRPALDQLYYDLVGDGEPKTISPEKLLKFLTETQGVANLDLEKVTKIIATHERNEPKTAMSLSGFRSLMVSEMFDIRKKEHREINQPMDRPLSHYWMKSSHNTYLLTDQLVGKSSIEGFRRAISRNCACVELDLWDGPNGEPIIYHGRTLVTRILARHVLRDGILPFAFLHDDYPIVLSIEDHLSDEQRKVFIKDFHDIMRDYVYIADTENMTGLPSLDQLKRKVIIKASKQEWGDLANICQTIHFSDEVLTPNAEPRPFYHVSSLSEIKIDSILYPTPMEKMLCKGKAAEIRRQKMREFTTRQLIRIYPGGHRQLSSNYNPIDSMNAGCQLAAMNVQTKCSNMAIYEGRFRANGDCAYALKPAFLLDPLAPRIGPKRFTIQIISAQNLPQGRLQIKPVSSPFVTARIDGDPSDCQKKSTKPVEDNGLNPVWNSVMKFNVKVPELAVILFQIKHTDGLLGWNSLTLGAFALPVLSLAPGYRHIPLQDKHMIRVPLATLFVKVTVEDI